MRAFEYIETLAGTILVTADDVIKQDIILVWTGERRIITGSDILGRLLRGIVIRSAGDAFPLPAVAPS